jgi:hypothetical protein
MLFGETVAVYCENHMKHTNTLCGQNPEFWCVKACGTYINHSLVYIFRKANFIENRFMFYFIHQEIVSFFWVKTFFELREFAQERQGEIVFSFGSCVRSCWRNNACLQKATITVLGLLFGINSVAIQTDLALD